MLATCLAAIFAQAAAGPADEPPPRVELIKAWEVRGRADDADFGRSLAWLGDIDADGLADLLVAAPQDETDEIREGEGIVRLLSGADGRELWAAAGGSEGAGLGHDLVVLDDVDVDGRPDFAVRRVVRQEARALDCCDDLGIEVRSGRDGHLIHALEWPALHVYEAGLASIADTDGDGHRDLLLGAAPPSHVDLPDGQPGASSALLFSGATGRLLRHLDDGQDAGPDLGAHGLALDALDADGAAGYALLGAGVPRLRVWRAGESMPRLDAVLVGEPPGPGAPALGLDDLDGDGVRDFVVSVRGVGRNPRHTGGPQRLLFLSGADARVLRVWRQPDEQPRTLTLAALPDVDGDGVGELLVATSFETWGRGVLRVLSPKNGQELGRRVGSQPNAGLGRALATCADPGDGRGPIVAVASGGRRGLVEVLRVRTLPLER